MLAFRMQGRQSCAGCFCSNDSHLNEEYKKIMKKMMIAMLAGLLSSSVWAAPFGAAPYPYQHRNMPAQGRMMPAIPPRQQLSEAAKTLQQGLGGLTEFLESGQQRNPAALQAFVETKVAHYFDFDYMAKWVAGSAQRHMDEQQKAALAARFKQEFVSTMIEKLAVYDNQAIHLLPSRPTSADQTTVSAMIVRAGNYPARLDFRMYKSANGWKVFDVLANGRSALIHYRQQYQRMLRPQIPQNRMPVFHPQQR